MKGFKATKNMKCLGLTYEIDKTYSINRLELCSTGFHFCQNMEDVLNYYRYNDDFVLLEVEALGKTITQGDKTVTDCIKIIRVIPKEEYTFQIPEPEIDPNIYEYDDRGNKISETYPDGNKTYYEYDDRNNRISVTDPDGDKYSYEYDDRGNKISETHPWGYKYSYDYDDRNNKISMTDSDGDKYSYEYDDRNNMISETDSDGYKTSWEYDDRNNKISETFNDEELYRITIN